MTTCDGGMLTYKTQWYTSLQEHGKAERQTFKGAYFIFAVLHSMKFKDSM